MIEVINTSAGFDYIITIDAKVKEEKINALSDLILKKVNDIYDVVASCSWSQDENVVSYKIIFSCPNDRRGDFTHNEYTLLLEELHYGIAKGEYDEAKIIFPYVYCKINNLDLWSLLNYNNIVM